MEELQEVHTDKNRALPEKKQKRIVKTPDQVAALENFYNEHKYPTESMKLELAESIGLTEKQVSGWFCHRRLKDKKSPNDEILTHGKQDRSSGVIQDRGSGLRQDSCGSTKQGDNNKHFDPKEVESRRFTTDCLLPTEIPFDHGSQRNIMMDMDDDDDDDTSSGSSSPLKNDLHPQYVDHSGMITSKYPTQIDVKSVKTRSGPSGYLKVKNQVENAAITAVKRQLGRNYQENGPPLGIEFEPLPPGAFESPAKIPVNQSYYVGDRAFHSMDGSKAFPSSNTSKVYDRFNRKSYHSADFDESGLDIRHASKHHELHSNSQYKQTSIHDHREHFDTRVKHGPGVRRPDSLSNRHVIAYGKNIDGKQAENYPHSHNIGTPKVNYRDRIEPLTSDLTVKRDEFEDRGLSRKTFKDDEFDGERRGIDEQSRLVSVKIHPGNEMRISKRSRDDFTHQAYPRKEVVVDIPPRINGTKRSTAHMTSSFSDDETAESTSSGD